MNGNGEVAHEIIEIDPLAGYWKQREADRVMPVRTLSQAEIDGYVIGKPLHHKPLLR